MKRHDKDGFPYYCRICGKAFKWNYTDEEITSSDWLQDKVSGGSNCPFFPHQEECMLEDEETAQSRVTGIFDFDNAKPGDTVVMTGLNTIEEMVNEYTSASELRRQFKHTVLEPYIPKPNPREREQYLKEQVMGKRWTRGYQFFYKHKEDVISIDGIDVPADIVLNSTVEDIEAVIELEKKIKATNDTRYYIPNPRIGKKDTGW